MNEIRSQLDERLESIESDLLEMMDMVTDRVGTVTSALLENDVAAADILIAEDDDIDIISLRVEEGCVETLVREQPVASDLRLVVAAMHMNSDIERSGDLTTNIAKAVGRLQGTQMEDRVRELVAQMAAQAALLFRRSAEAYRNRDPELAASIDELDDVLDDLHYEFIQLVIHEARRGDMDPQQSLQLALIGRFYERIGDHAENIGERVQYIVSGWLPESQAAERVAARDAGLEPEGVTSRGMAVIDSIAEERRIDAIRQDFVANVSHELKTPVGAMSLLAEALASADGAADRERLSNLLQRESKRAEDIIDDLLELARLDEEDSVFSVVAIDDVVARAIETATNLATIKGIEVVTKGVPSGAEVMGSRRELSRALVNLIDNAVRYSERGTQIVVDVEMLPGAVDVAVRDEGEGIPRPELERIFERFYRVDRARSRDTGGTGLGLAIVRHVATNHRGRVLVESKPGEGSAFTLRLPTVGS
ncbi:MAG: phosphate signaling complex protein PhoU [Actinomycetota bacterium]